MKTIIDLCTSLILAVWLVTIAIISVQNATPVTLSFLFWHSIQIPMGLVMAFSAAIGLLLVALLQALWLLNQSGKSNSRLDDDPEFFVDDEDF
jgi:uncharacterized integral membrane protein